MKFLVWDLGLSLEHALRLAKDGNEVYYFTPWVSAYSHFEPYAYGLGLLQKVKFFYDYIDKVDCIVFFDIGAGDLANYLRRKGYTVYGAGLGEELEYDRFVVRKLQKKLGMAVQDTVKINGVDNLINFLQDKQNKYVKSEIFRGDCESFRFRDYKADRTYLQEMKTNLGPVRNFYDFVVEDFIEGLVEIGCDLHYNGKSFVKPYLWGYEYKKKCYIGKYVDELPEPLQVIHRLEPTMRDLDYRGAFSAEFIVNENGSHLIDICSRYAYPLSLAYTNSINNFSQLVYDIANANDTVIDNKNKYIGAVPIASYHADQHWTDVRFPEEIRNNVKLVNACKVDNEYYIKGDKIWITVVDTADTVEELVENLKKLVSQVDAHEIDTDAVAGLDDIVKLSEKGENVGLGL